MVTAERVNSMELAIVDIGLQNHGQGHETTLAQVAADALGVAPEQVRVRHGDPIEVSDSVGSE